MKDYVTVESKYKVTKAIHDNGVLTIFTDNVILKYDAEGLSYVWSSQIDQLENKLKSLL